MSADPVKVGVTCYLVLKPKFRHAESEVPYAVEVDRATKTRPKILSGGETFVEVRLQVPPQVFAPPIVAELDLDPAAFGSVPVTMSTVQEWPGAGG